ncbi:MAG: BlaI/MecI/CopY family transcriptional regulator [Bacteroidota bacterium]
MKPTESELEILQVLWINGSATVRFVNEQLNLRSDKEIGYTTTLKLMQLMLTKGFLDRDDSTRTHIYKSAVEERAVKQGLLSQFVNKAFRGSAAQLVMEALGQHRTSDDELAKIKALIAKMEDDKTKDNE